MENADENFIGEISKGVTRSLMVWQAVQDRYPRYLVAGRTCLLTHSLARGTIQEK